MGRTYAVAWQVGDGPVLVGRLALDAGLVLEGLAGRLRVDRADVLSVETATGPRRLGRRPTLSVLRLGGERVSIAPLDGPGRAHELHEAISLLSLHSHPQPTCSIVLSAHG